MWKISRKGATRKEAQRIRDAYRKSFSPVRMTSPEVFVGEATVKKRKFDMTERGEERKMKGRKRKRRRKVEGRREETRGRKKKKDRRRKS